MFVGNLLRGRGLVLDAAVHEARKVGRGLLDGSSLLGDGELLHELVEHLDGLLVLSHGDGWLWVLFVKGLVGIVSFYALSSIPRAMRSAVEGCRKTSRVRAKRSFFSFSFGSLGKKRNSLGKERGERKKECVYGGGRKEEEEGREWAGWGRSLFIPWHSEQPFTFFLGRLGIFGHSKNFGALSLFFFFSFRSFLLGIGGRSLGLWQLSPTIHEGGTGTAAGGCPSISSFFARPSPLCGKLPLATRPTRAA